MDTEAKMLMEQMASRLNTAPEQLERESLRLYLMHQLRLVETEFLNLTRQYGVQTIFDLDQAVAAGQFSEATVFEDYFRLDHLEAERLTLRELLSQL